ncbi:SMEK domain-containing protein [Variovorax sp. VRV01]|uniref:SMEK domain-containing protein n=1 Tax=Variovorax sp. VRV01 TaxID=2769259 RepID=UPI00177D3F25|nr:SMEK domain-containing protein [Variovorax sp. VRV01]MBD9667078.1 SMEK domain-containing protein [Variovorax sp. VRV01]
MKILDLQNEFRELIAQLRHEIEAASAMGQFDAHKVSENLMCGLLRELCDWSALRNLNTEQSNFPGIDLADDTHRVAIQITATADIGKVKYTLEQFVSHDLHQRYDRLIVYVLTAKQGSYSQAAIEVACAGKHQFSAGTDVWDYKELCSKAADAEPHKLQAALNHLKAYLRGVPVGLADEDIDPPLAPAESLTANLVELYFPSTLYIARLSVDLVERHGKRKPGLWRETIREFNQENDSAVPSAYVIHSGNLVSFFDLTDRDNPYKHLIESGTTEAHRPGDYWTIDEDHERVFKSLLRFSLQQRLFKERVRWENDGGEFVFLPLEDGLNQREETWQGEKKAKRTVFARRFNKKDRSKVYLQKHLSFAVEFLLFGDLWFMAITPSWFFSYGAAFKESGFSQDNLSWIKRQENNQQVMNHFRFLSAWLRTIDDEDLFSEKKLTDSFLSFGSALTLGGAPSLEESGWATLPSASEEDSENPTRMFG